MRLVVPLVVLVLASCSDSSSSSPTAPTVAARAQATVTMQSGARVQLWADSLFFRAADLNQARATAHYGSTCEEARVEIADVRRLDPIRAQPCNLGQYCGQCGSGRRWVVFLDASGRAEEALLTQEALRGERVDSGQAVTIRFSEMLSLEK